MHLRNMLKIQQKLFWFREVLRRENVLVHYFFLFFFFYKYVLSLHLKKKRLKRYIFTKLHRLR